VYRYALQTCDMGFDCQRTVLMSITFISYTSWPVQGKITNLWLHD